jgi:hypothetical protein
MYNILNVQMRCFVVVYVCIHTHTYIYFLFCCKKIMEIVYTSTYVQRRKLKKNNGSVVAQ